MNRVNFAYRSGVVVDKCRDHGLWLKSGELIHLLEWKKAGGQSFALIPKSVVCRYHPLKIMDDFSRR